MVNVREGRKRPYTILQRRQRAGSLRAVKYIILTNEASVISEKLLRLNWKFQSAPAKLKRQTLVLDFSILNNENFSPITYMSHYAHIKSSDIQKAARHVFVTNILPFCVTTITGARPMLGNVSSHLQICHHSFFQMYGRMALSDGESINTHIMTVPQISMIGVGSEDMFKDLKNIGTGVFASWPRDYTTGIFTFARDGLLAVPPEGYEEEPSKRWLKDKCTEHIFSEYYVWRCDWDSWNQCKSAPQSPETAISHRTLQRNDVSS